MYEKRIKFYQEGAPGVKNRIMVMCGGSPDTMTLSATKISPANVGCGGDGPSVQGAGEKDSDHATSSKVDAPRFFSAAYWLFCCMACLSGYSIVALTAREFLPRPHSDFAESALCAALAAALGWNIYCAESGRQQRRASRGPG